MKTIILIQIKGKLKQFNCSIEAGKLCFDFKNNVTMITDGKERLVRRQNNVEPKVKQVFLPLIEKKKNAKADSFVMEFDFPKNTLIFSAYFDDGTTERKAV